MCALAGIFALDKRLYPEDAEIILKAMGSSINHRGPESLQFLNDPENGCGLVHCRLRIQDPHPESDQPFFSENGAVSVIFNGQIYNHRELRSKLEKEGFIFRTKSDVEVLLNAYRHFGSNFLAELDGVFALVIHDKNKQLFFMARDRFGVKPLYFTFKSGLIIFASQMDALFQVKSVEKYKKVSAFAAKFYKNFMAAPAPLTVFSNIYKLPAAFACEVQQRGKPKIFRWYNLLQNINSDLGNISYQDALSTTKDLLVNAVKKRTDSLRSIGVFYSGGLDSSLLLAIASNFVPDIKAFSLHLDQPDTPDLQNSHKLTAKLGIDHHKILLHGLAADKFIRKMLHSFDEPLCDPVNVAIMALAKEVSGENLKVALCGEGADELFWGYKFYAKNHLFNVAKKSPAFFLSHYVVKAFNSLKLKDPYKILSLINSFYNKVDGNYCVSSTVDQEADFQDHHWKYERFLINKLFGQDVSIEANFTDSMWSNLEKELDGFCFSTKQAVSEYNFRLPELILNRTDKISGLYGIETRVPFLDHQLIEFVLSLPAWMSSNSFDLKRFLRDVAKEFLPTEFIQPKVGFAVPHSDWSFFLETNYLKNKEIESKNSLSKWTTLFVDNFVSRHKKLYRSSKYKNFGLRP